MGFHFSKFRPLLGISSARVQPKPKTRPFVTNSSPSRAFHSSTSITLPEYESPSYFNSLITIHGRNGDVRGAEKAFARIPGGDVISRNNMITVYGKNGEIEKARKMFDEMPERTTSSYNAMITAYGKSDMAEQAYEIFSSMPERNAVSYGAMISAFVREQMLARADRLLSETPSEFRDPVCSSLVLQGYLKEGNLNDAYRIFEAMAVRDVVSWSSMIDGYCRAGLATEARGLFDAAPEKNVITWTLMIHGYFKNGDFEEGFNLFSSMRREEKRVDLNSDTLTVMFGGCKSFSKCREGFQIHGLALRVGFRLEGFLGTSIVSMYSRFGDMVSATKIVESAVNFDEVMCNSLVHGYIQCGDIQRALEIFKKMPKLSMSLCTKMIAELFSNGLTDKAVRLFEAIPLRKDSQCCSTLIWGLLNNNRREEAFRWFNELRRDEDIRVGSEAFCNIISASECVNQGKQFHGMLIKKNMESELSIQNALAAFYLKCQCFSEVPKVFAHF